VGSVYSPVPAQFLPGGLNKIDAERLNLAYDQDIAQARRLMIDAGYPDGFSLDLVTSEKRLYRTYYEEMRRQLSQIGIDCRISRGDAFKHAQADSSGAETDCHLCRLAP
jgi:peptide/nickel transport system substrate-binding protein